MIYFNEESRKKLIEKLYRALKPGGYLFVGHTELLPRNHELFEVRVSGCLQEIEAAARQMTEGERVSGGSDGKEKQIF